MSGCLRYHRHPDYSSRSLSHDIAVAVISSGYGQGAAWSDAVLPACLPQVGRGELYSVGRRGTVSGWGLLDEKSSRLSDSLQYVNVPIVGHNTCRKAYSDLVKLDKKYQFCAGGSDRKQDACSGDSGWSPSSLDP